MSPTIIYTKQAPEAIGPYSQAIGFEKLIFTSGQLPLDPKTGKIVSGGIEAQTRQSILNLQSILKEGGSDLSQVLKTTVLLSDMNNFDAMNKVYAEFFTGNFPARSAVQVARLPMDAMVEIEVAAFCSDAH
jgi:2-iminobutanoate/2-iminopropanoate deaminase